MTDIARDREALVKRIVEGEGTAPSAERRAAFDGTLEGPLGELTRTVAARAHDVTEEQFAAARATGADEDQLFELVVCAAAGEATRMYDAALAALDAATKGD